MLLNRTQQEAAEAAAGQRKLLNYLVSGGVDTDRSTEEAEGGAGARGGHSAAGASETPAASGKLISLPTSTIMYINVVCLL